MDKEQVKTLRVWLKLTQKELAAKLGVCSRTVSAWERGEKRPSRMAVRLLRQLAASHFAQEPDITAKVARFAKASLQTPIPDITQPSLSET